MSLRLANIQTSSRGQAPLRNLSLEFARGSFNVLLGPTGAGKTELLRVMAGLDPVDAGRIFAGDVDVTGRDVRRRSVAFVYQEFINYPNLSVYENIASPLRVRRASASKDEVDAAVRRVAERLGLTTLLDRLPGRISGGQQQRVALARALVREAELVLLDEPLVNLDYKLRERLRREIRELFRDSESIVVFATSDPTEAQLLGGRLTVLADGRVLQSGPAAEQYRLPRTRAAADILSDPPLNFLEARREAGALRIPGTELAFTGQAELPERCYLALRPQALRLDRRPGDGQLAGVVKLAELAGSETFLHVRTVAGDLIVREKGTRPHSMEENVQLFAAESDLFVYSLAGDLLHAPERPAP